MRTKNEYKNDDFYKSEVSCKEDFTKEHDKFESSVHKLLPTSEAFSLQTQI